MRDPDIFEFEIDHATYLSEQLDGCGGVMYLCVKGKRNQKKLVFPWWRNNLLRNFSNLSPVPPSQINLRRTTRHWLDEAKMMEGPEGQEWG